MNTNWKSFVLCGMILVASWLLLTSFTLVKTNDRNGKSVILPQTLSTQIQKESKGMTVMQIMDYSLDMTAQLLKFTATNDIFHGKANCVGYAQLCSAICNKAFSINDYSCRAKPVVGYLKMSSINLCDLAKSVMPTTKMKNFVKDHDFVELSYNGKTYYFDPSMYDYIGNKCWTIK